MWKTNSFIPIDVPVLLLNQSIISVTFWLEIAKLSFHSSLSMRVFRRSIEDFTIKYDLVLSATEVYSFSLFRSVPPLPSAPSYQRKDQAEVPSFTDFFLLLFRIFLKAEAVQYTYT